jgi:hypothetical protein
MLAPEAGKVVVVDWVNRKLIFTLKSIRITCEAETIRSS